MLSKLNNLPDSIIKELEDQFMCPINNSIMIDPVILNDDSHSYERQSIIEWLTINKTSPITGKEVNGRIITNYDLKSAIEYSIDREVEKQEIGKYGDNINWGDIEIISELQNSNYKI